MLTRYGVKQVGGSPPCVTLRSLACTSFADLTSEQEHLFANTFSEMKHLEELELHLNVAGSMLTDSLSSMVALQSLCLFVLPLTRPMLPKSPMSLYMTLWQTFCVMTKTPITIQADTGEHARQLLASLVSRFCFTL